MQTLPRLPLRCAAALAVAAAIASISPGAAFGADVEPLSDERTHSLWAEVDEPVFPRVGPGEDKEIVRDHRGRPKRLDVVIPDTDAAEIVLVLRQTIIDEEPWVEVRLPMRPNNTTGWVPLDDLGPLREVQGYLLIDRGSLRATLFDANGRSRWSAAVGVGISRWPTPAGRYYVREMLLVPRKSRGGYGPFAFGTSALSPTLSGGNWGEGVVGLHGTGQPRLIPGRISHGCIRVKNSKIMRLRRLMGLGTPILIR